MVLDFLLCVVKESSFLQKVKRRMLKYSKYGNFLIDQKRGFNSYRLDANMLLVIIQLTFTCSKPTMKTLKKV